MNYWLVKSEPDNYPWEQLQKDGRAVWDGVRNYQARNTLQAMRQDDPVLFYHSRDGLAIVGIAAVAREAYQDPTTNDPRWVAVDLRPVRALQRPVTLGQIKADKRLRQMGIVRQARLSVMPLTPEEFHAVLELGDTTL